MIKLLKYGIYYIFIILCGIFIGLISWSFLFIINTILHFLWLGQEIKGGILYHHLLLIPLFIISISMFLAYTYTKFTIIPKPGIMYAKEYQEYKRVKYRDFFKIYFLAMLPIIIGASVGPEAALIGLLFMMSSFISDVTKAFESKFKVKLIKVKREKFKENLLHNKLYLLKIILLYSSSASSMLFLLNKDKFPPFNLKLMPLTINFGDTLITKGLFVVIAASTFLTVGYYFGKFYHYSEKLIAKLFAYLQNIYLKMLISSCLLTFFALFLPILILSGEGTLHILSEQTILKPAFLLIILAFLKIIITHICLNGNLKGGHIFPIIFSAFLLGSGIGLLLNIDLTLAIASVTVGTTLSIFSSWLGIFLLLALFFPFKFLFILFIIALIFRERLAAEKGSNEL